MERNTTKHDYFVMSATVGKKAEGLQKISSWLLVLLWLMGSYYFVPPPLNLYFKFWLNFSPH